MSRKKHNILYEYFLGKCKQNKGEAVLCAEESTVQRPGNEGEVVKNLVRHRNGRGDEILHNKAPTGRGAIDYQSRGRNVYTHTPIGNSRAMPPSPGFPHQGHDPCLYSAGGVKHPTPRGGGWDPQGCHFRSLPPMCVITPRVAVCVGLRFFLYIMLVCPVPFCSHLTTQRELEEIIFIINFIIIIF